MSGVTSIVNPLTPEGRDVLLFTVSDPGKQLALELRNLDSNSYTPYVDNGCEKGAVKPNSRLAATIHQRMVTVYGITNYTLDSKSAQTVATLTPIYNPIDKVTSGGLADPGSYYSIAATGDGEQFDWVYFLQDPSGSPRKPLITEYEFSLAEAGNRYVYKKLEPDPESNLAVVLHASSNNRMIIFQGPDVNLYYSWSGPKSENPIRGTNAALKGTPLAASVVSLDDDIVEIYLYYIDNRGQLLRIVYSGTEESGLWGSVQEVSRATLANTTTGLTVIPDVQKQVNHIWYQRSSEKKYTAVQDDFRKRTLDSNKVNANREAYVARVRAQAEAERLREKKLEHVEHHQHDAKHHESRHQREEKQNGTAVDATEQVVA